MLFRGRLGSRTFAFALAAPLGLLMQPSAASACYTRPERWPEEQIRGISTAVVHGSFSYTASPDPADQGGFDLIDGVIEAQPRESNRPATYRVRYNSFWSFYCRGYGWVPTGAGTYRGRFYLRAMRDGTHQILRYEP